VTLAGFAHMLALLVLSGHAFVVLCDQLDWIPAMGPDQVWAAPGAIFGSAAAGLLLIGLAPAGRWPDRRITRELALLAALPPVVLIAVSFVTSSLWVPRSPRVWFFRQWQTGEPLSDAGPLTGTLTRDYRQVQVRHATKATLVLLERR
jgi:hypothetical protein